MSIPGFITYEFKRRNIEILYLDTDLQQLTAWLKHKEAFTSYLHRVIFTIDGYGEDTRDLSKVPEIVAFFNELHKRWPYFLNFCLPNPSIYAWWVRIFFSNWAVPDNARKKNVLRRTQLSINGGMAYQCQRKIPGTRYPEGILHAPPERDDRFYSKRLASQQDLV